MEDKELKELKYLPMDIINYPRKEDVVGRSRQFIDDFLLAMDSEQLYNAMGVNPDKSFLVTGSPGNGKSYGIEALVNEANKEMYDTFQKNKGNQSIEKVIPNLFGFKYDIGRYGTAYINQGSKIIQGFFDTCFTIARKGYKTLAIFDEADVLFGKRSSLQSHKEDSKVIETIMKNMQTAHDLNNMYTIIMSNFPDVFDEASIRAGRIDKKYIFNSPNLSERETAYQHTINKINDKAGYQVVRGYGVEKLSQLSDGFSYADIAESVNSAVKQRVKELSNIRKDKIIIAGYISQNRLENSIKHHKSNFQDKKNIIGFKHE